MTPEEETCKCYGCTTMRKKCVKEVKQVLLGPHSSGIQPIFSRTYHREILRPTNEDN